MAAPSLPHGFVIKPSYTSMRGLQAFIKDIRQCKSKEAEQKRISKELTHILQKFKDLKKQKNPKEEGYQRKKYVCKLVFMHLLGAEVDFGYVEAIELVGSTRLSEKHMGYLACTMLPMVEPDNASLLFTKIKADLTSSKPMISALALDCIACVGTKEIADATAASVLQVLLGRATLSAQKKSALVLLRLHRQDSTLIGRLLGTDEKKRQSIIALIEHRDMGLVTAVSTLLAALADEAPALYKDCVEKAVNALKRIRGTSGSNNAYMYKGQVAPWTVVKLLKLLQCFPLPDDEKLSERIESVLKPLLKDHDLVREIKGKKRSVNTMNSRNMILFEALNLIVAYDVDMRDLFVEAVSIVGLYILSKEVNWRYLGLATMSALAKSDITKVAVSQHQEAIFKSLKDKDVSIRQRSLNLLYNMCNEENCERIVGELLKYLVTCDYGIREELVLVIAILAEIPFRKFTDEQGQNAQEVAKAEKWYVDVILKLMRLAGDYVSTEVWFRVLHIIVSTEHDEIQDYATKVVFEMLQDPTCHETAVKVGGYILGEFGHLIANDPESVPELQFRALWAHYLYVSNATRSLLLTSFIKLRNLFAEIKPMVDTILRNTRQSANSDPEIQQRAIEYLGLSSKASDVLLEKVLDEMPVFPKNKIKASKLVELLDKKAGYGDAKNKRNQRRGTKPSQNGPESVKKQPSTNGVTPPTTSSSLVDVETNADIFTAPPQVVGGTAVIERVRSDDPAVLTNIKLFASKRSGVLHEDEVVQIGVKTQWKGNKGKVEFFVGNKTTDTTFVNPVIQISQVPGLVITAYEQGNPQSMGPKGQTLIAYLVECADFFQREPDLTLSFRHQNQIFKYNLKFPVYLSNFVAGVTLSKETFITKWQQLSAPGLEQKPVFETMKDVSTVAAKQAMTGLNMQILEGVEPNPQNVVSAGVLTTEAGPVGILVRIEPNAQMKMYRATVRSSKESVTSIFADIVQGRL